MKLAVWFCAAKCILADYEDSNYYGDSNYEYYISYYDPDGNKHTRVATLEEICADPEFTRPDCPEISSQSQIDDVYDSYGVPEIQGSPTPEPYYWRTTDWRTTSTSSYIWRTTTRPTTTTTSTTTSTTTTTTTTTATTTTSTTKDKPCRPLVDGPKEVEGYDLDENKVIWSLKLKFVKVANPFECRLECEKYIDLTRISRNEEERRRCAAFRYHKLNNWCFLLEQTPESAGLSYAEDKNYDLYIKRAAHCPVKNDVVDPCIHGALGPRGCSCEHGWDGFDCGTMTCDNGDAPECFGGRCRRYPNPHDTFAPSFGCDCPTGTQYYQERDECAPPQIPIAVPFDEPQPLSDLIPGHPLDNSHAPTIAEDSGEIDWVDGMWQWTEGSERFRSFPSVRFSFDQPKSISCITTSGGQGGYVSEFNLYNTGAESGNREFIQTIEVDTKDVTQQKTACLSSPLTTSDLIIMPTGGSKDFFMRFLIYQL